MTTAFKDEKGKRHLIVSFQFDTNRIKVNNFPHLNASWSTERIIPIVRYEYMSEEEYHSKARANIAIRAATAANKGWNGPKLVKEKCFPVLK